MSGYAPIVLFTYNRIDELKQTISALQKNLLASESVLFVYSDAAKNEENIFKVKQVRDYLYSINSFKKIHIIERQKNFGLARSVIEGVSEIIGEYGKIIVLEDDLITSKNFLSYMNQALAFYATQERVFSISGFTLPLKNLNNYANDSYVTLRPASWGWGAWHDRWESVDWDVSDFNEFKHDKESIRLFNRGGIDLTRMLKHCMTSKNNSWAVRWAYAMFKADKYCIYPKISKVQNIGFGADATHCNGANIYKSILDESVSCDFDFVNEIVPDKRIIDEFRYQYSYTNKLIKKLLGYIGILHR